MLRRGDAPVPHPGRTTRAEPAFVRGGGRTVLARQSVPYPFHATRPHHRDPDRPDFATLILQSASGGLFGGDRLGLAIAAGTGAAAHVKSQAATVVPAGSDGGATMETRIAAREGSFLAVTTDPYILFPGADLSVSTGVEPSPGATVILAEGSAVHDPVGADRPFAQLSARCRVAGPDDALLIDEAGDIDGAAFLGRPTPLGPFRAFGAVMVLGAAASRLDPAAIEDGMDALGLLAGASLARGLDAVVVAGLTAEALIGFRGDVPLS